MELAYPSEVYCNLSLMIGSSVIDGGLPELPTPLFSPPSPLFHTEAHRIFEMCFAR